MTERPKEEFTLPAIGLLEPRPGARPGGDAQWRAPSGRALVHWAWLGTAQKRDMDTHPCKPTPHRIYRKGQVQCVLNGGQGGAW